MSQQPTPEVKDNMQLFLAFDYGQKRTGVASGNRITQTARALPTVKGEGKLRWPAIDQLIKEWQPDALVIGVPYHPDGQPRENTVLAKKFGRQLYARCGLTIFEVDERYSTVEATAQGAKDPDGGAACIILEQFLRSIQA